MTYSESERGGNMDTDSLAAQSNWSDGEERDLPNVTDASSRSDSPVGFLLSDLAPSGTAACRQLTFPAFRPILDRAGLDSHVVAAVASRYGRPIGLGLADLANDHSVGMLRSLLVRPGYRRLGIGAALLRSVEASAAERGCQRLWATYMTGGPTDDAVARVLDQGGWAPPKRRMVIYHATSVTMERAAWLHLYRLPDEYSIFPWRDLTAEDRHLILERKARDNWYKDGLSPFMEEDRLEYMNSLGLRYRGVVVGWMTTHRIAHDVVRFSQLFLDPTLRGIGRAAILMAESIKLCMAYAALHNMRETLQAIWAVDVSNAPMVRFAERYLAPYAVSTQETWGTDKLLASPAQS
jgi:GNAT superfamily N-acetyltransferase